MDNRQYEVTIGRGLVGHPFVILSLDIFVVRFLPFSLLTVFFIFAGGCASVSVYENARLTSVHPKKMPVKIYVRDFEAPPKVFRVDRSGEALETFLTQAQQRLTKELVLRIGKHLVPAEALKGNAPAPQGNYWLVEGKFDRVNQGSRALRSLIGFGMGGTKTEVTARLLDLSGTKPRPLYQIRTTGGSGAEPGGIAGIFPFGMIPFGVVINAAAALRGGVVIDTERTAKEITADFSQYAYQNRLIPEEKRLHPKVLGEIPNHVMKWLPGEPLKP